MKRWPLTLIAACMSLTAPAAAQSRPAPSDAALVRDARRAFIVNKALGDAPLRHEADDFVIVADPRCAELVPLAASVLEQAHDDFRQWAASVAAPIVDSRSRHVVMLLFDNAAYRQAVRYAPAASVLLGSGFYDDHLRILYWFDQRRGRQMELESREAASDLSAVESFRKEIERARKAGRIPRLGLLGHRVPQRSLEECEAYAAWMEHKTHARQEWFKTPEAGVYPLLLRHEFAHQLFFEHGLMAQPVPAWLCEGTAMLLESMDRGSAVPRPGVNARRLNMLRTFLAQRGAIDTFNQARAELYPTDAIARNLALREMVHNNFITQDNPDAAGPLYYARFWAFTYYLACERPADLLSCLRACLEGQPPNQRDGPSTPGSRPVQSWVRLFESVFGDDYASLERDMAAFLVRVFNENDEA